MHSWQGGGDYFDHRLVESEVKAKAEVRAEEEESEVKAETMKEAEVKADQLGLKAEVEEEMKGTMSHHLKNMYHYMGTMLGMY